jgi:Putative auto-transporter adhesin, head GIN domain
MKPRLFSFLIILLFSTTLVFSQKAEKIKGSKVVTSSIQQVKPFTMIEVEDNIEIHLEKGAKSEIKIEADDNLHDVISLKVENNILIISTSKEIQGFKKLSIKVTYTNDLNLVTAKDESVINAIQEIILDTITFKSLDKSKLFLNVNAGNFNLQADDKSKIELNLKSETSFIELSKNSSLKALINSAELKCDLYQKSSAIIEGDSDNSIIRIDNLAELNASKFNSKTSDLTIEGKASCSLLVENNFTLDANDNTEINVYGNPKIEIRKFSGEAKLLKKLPLKK